MHLRISKGKFCVIGLVVVVSLTSVRVWADEALPSAALVLQRLLEHARQTNRVEESSYTYEKRSVVEELDSAGKPTKTTAKIFRVAPIEGVPFSRLVKFQDRDLTAEELKTQDKKEQEFRSKLAAHDPKLAAERNGDSLNEELLDRYEFKMERRELSNNRPALVMSFRPKKGRPAEKSAQDKVLNRLAGQVWVDEAESEIVRVRVGLVEDLSLGWFGMIGSIRQCDVTIERQRLPEDVWVNKTFAVLLGGRKVFSSMRYRTSDAFYDFRKP